MIPSNTFCVRPKLAKLARINSAGERHKGDHDMLIVLFVATFALLSLAFVPGLSFDD
jgi:hypothetical protein